MSQIEEVAENVIRKKIKIPYMDNGWETRYYCGKCRAELMWADEFPDVASAVVNETADCKHYEWETMRSNPRLALAGLADPDDWRYKLEQPLLDQIKNRIVFVYAAPSRYYVLLKKMSKN